MWPFKKKIKLVAVTSTPHLTETFPIVEAQSCLPKWYKSTPLAYEKGVCPVQHSITNKAATIKGCTGVNSLLRTGFILPAWEDISLVVYPDGAFSSVGAHTNPPTSAHDKRQLPVNMQNYTIIKLISPWYLYGDETEYMFTPAIYHTAITRNYFMPPGIVNYKYQHATNVFLAVEPKQEPYEILIKAGDPLVYITPLTKQSVSMSVKWDAQHIAQTPIDFFLFHKYQRYTNWLKRKKDAS